MLRSLELACYQGIMTFLTSRYVFFPVYREKGLVAAIGTHTAWNSIGVSLQYLYPRVLYGSIQISLFVLKLLATN